jgi:hypothetical protein
MKRLQMGMEIKDYYLILSTKYSHKFLPIGFYFSFNTKWGAEGETQDCLACYQVE